MSHFVPDFESDEDFLIPSFSSSSSLNLSKKSAMAEDDIMELLWQNGQVVVQSQTQQRAQKKSSPLPELGGDQSTIRGGSPPSHQQPSDHHLFMQEDEMVSWLHYPLHEDDFCSDLLYSDPFVASTSTSQPPRVSHEASEKVMPTVTVTTAAVTRPPIPPATRTETEPRATQNFVLFSRLKGSHTRGQAVPSVSKAVVRESAVVDSRVTTAAAGSEVIGRTESASGRTGARVQTIGGASAAGGSSSSVVPGVISKDTSAPCEVSVTSSPGISGASADPAYKPLPAEDRKRKGREADEVECHSEDVKPAARGSTSTKRSRAAEVHNLSERRRRDRINEKMKALQDLIPRCNKSDKASMLDEAIEYLKSLQLQIQMMSMGCGYPMMYPGIQQYMPHVAMGLGMEMGMNRPLMPFPGVLPGAALPNAGHLGGPRFPVPVFPVPTLDPSRIQASNQPEPMAYSFRMQNLNHPNVPSFADPYQQFPGFLQMQAPPGMQNQVTPQASSSNPGTTTEPKNLENHQSG